MGLTAVAFVVYLLFVLGVGVYSVRLTKDLKDFALGGHRLGPWVIAFSERASGESAWLILGLPGAALVAGLLELWTVIGCVGGIMLSWLIIASPLRRATEKFGALTLPELFARHFEDESGTIRVLSAAIITFFFMFYVAAQFSGAGKVLNVTFGISELQGMVLGAVIIVFYTLLGGFFAVAWTDLIQGIIMIGTLVILPLVGWIKLAGVPHDPIANWSTLFAGKEGVGAFIGALGGLSWGLGYLGQPHLVVRYMAIDRTEHIAKSRWIAYSWAVPGFLGSLLIGLVGFQLISTGQLQFNGAILTSIDQLPDPEKLMPLMAQNLMPPLIAGIIISGAIAAMMSTADSQLLVSTTVLTEDFARRYYGTELTDRLSVFVGRLFTVIIGLFAFTIALVNKDLVFELVSYAWSGLGASFGPALILTLWWKKTTRNGVVAGMVTGALSTIIWANVTAWQALMTERLVSFVLAFLAVVLVSWFDRKGLTHA